MLFTVVKIFRKCRGECRGGAMRNTRSLREKGWKERGGEMEEERERREKRRAKGRQMRRNGEGEGGRKSKSE